MSSSSARKVQVDVGHTRFSSPHRRRVGRYHRPAGQMTVRDPADARDSNQQTIGGCDGNVCATCGRGLEGRSDRRTRHRERQARGAFTLPVTFPSRVSETGGRQDHAGGAARGAARGLLRDGVDQHDRQAGRQGVPRARDGHGHGRQERRRHQGRIGSHLKAMVEGLRGHRRRRAAGTGHRRREGLPDLERDPRERGDRRRSAGGLTSGGAAGRARGSGRRLRASGSR